MKSFEIQSLAQTAKKLYDGSYKVESIYPYVAVDQSTGEEITAYIALIEGEYYKVPPIGCRTINACLDDIMSTIRNPGLVMEVKTVHGKRDYKLVTFKEA